MQVVNFARLRRPSFSSSELPSVHIPHMTDNVLYDMESTTSPSSSDSDSSPKDRAESPAVETPEITAHSIESHSIRKLKSLPPKPSGSMVRLKEKHPKSRSISPLKEISVNHKLERVSSTRQRQLSASGDQKMTRMLNLSAQKDSTPHKRWV